MTLGRQTVIRIGELTDEAEQGKEEPVDKGRRERRGGENVGGATIDQGRSERRESGNERMGIRAEGGAQSGQGGAGEGEKGGVGGVRRIKGIVSKDGE